MMNRYSMWYAFIGPKNVWAIFYFTENYLFSKTLIPIKTIKWLFQCVFRGLLEFYKNQQKITWIWLQIRALWDKIRRKYTFLFLLYESSTCRALRKCLHNMPHFAVPYIIWRFLMLWNEWLMFSELLWSKKKMCREYFSRWAKKYFSFR